MDLGLIVAGAAGVSGFVVGALVASILRRSFTADTRPKVMRDIAPAVGSFVFWIFVAVGLVIAMAVIAPSALADIPSRIVVTLPNVVVAGLFLIIGKVFGILASTAVGQTLERTTGRRQLQVEALIRNVTLVFSVLLALGQLGIETAILNMVVAGVIAALALSAALLVGLGGRTVASNIAAGRSVRRVIQPGSHLRADSWSGLVAKLHPVIIEVRTDDGRTLLVPYTGLLEGPLEIDQVVEPPD